MKIALVANSFPTLSETFIYNHAAGLQARGVDVTVFASRSGDTAMFDTAEPRFTGKVRRLVLRREPIDTASAVVSLLPTRSRHAIDRWRASVSMYGVSRRAARAWLLALPFKGYDIVHLEYSGLAVSWLDALPLFAPARVVVSCRGAAEQITPLVDPRRGPLLRDVFQHSDRVHCVSEDMLRTCEQLGLSRSKAFVNRPAIDIRRFKRQHPYSPHSNGPIRLLSTGRLHWKKGIEFALLAVRQLVDSGYDVRYEILGAGDDDEMLRFTARDLGLEAVVSFLGRQSSNQVRAALERANVYLLPSLSEGISNAALEAMAMELPVVATTAGGMSEVIVDGENGMLVAPRDPRAMADRVALLLDDAPRRVRMGMAARARIIEAFTLERQMDVYLDEYGRLLAEVRT
jgi:colanic acid/amylovoran biosynthesis glycosyltransferase